MFTFSLHYDIHYPSLNKLRKTFIKKSENVSFCFCKDKKDVAKNVYEVDQELGGGESSLSVCPGVGNRPPIKKKLQLPEGGMVTSTIEPCIRRIVTDQEHTPELDMKN